MENIKDIIEKCLKIVNWEMKRVKINYGRACGILSEVIDNDLSIPKELTHDRTMVGIDALWEYIYKPDYDELKKLKSVIRNYEITFQKDQEEKIRKIIYK